MSKVKSSKNQKKGSSKKGPSKYEPEKLNKELDEYFDLISNNTSNQALNISNSGTSNIHSFTNTTSGSSGHYITNGSMNVVWPSLSTSNRMPFEKIFINVTKHLTEEDVVKMLNAIKEKNVSIYDACLINFISYPNYRLPSEQFLMDNLEYIKNIVSDFNFEMIYGNLLDNMNGLKLLLKLKDK
jgi:hypothetical protein